MYRTVSAAVISTVRLDGAFMFDAAQTDPVNKRPEHGAGTNI